MAEINFTQFDLKQKADLKSGDFLVGYKNDGSREFRTTLNSLTGAIQTLQGVQGLNGPQGVIGIQGFQGVPGNRGVQGVQGVQGIAGLLNIDINNLNPVLTGLLVTNNAFNSYKTDVASATASNINYVHSNFLPLTGEVSASSVITPRLQVRDGVVILTNLPTLSTNLPSGAIWSSNGILRVV